MWVGAQDSIGRLPFSNTANTMTVRFFAPNSGLSIKLKAEDATNGAISVETDAVTTTAGWQTLTFNFANPSPGTNAFNAANTYNKLSIFPSFSCGTAAPGVEQIFYVGPITFVGADGPSAPPLGTAPANSYAVLDFNTSGTTYTLTPFGGLAAELTSTGVPTGGPTNLVAKLTRPATAECFAGTTMSTGNSLSIGRVPFSSTATTMTVRFYSSAAGSSIKLKVENATDNTVTVETDQVAAAGWQTLTFNFANQSPGTAALNTASTYNKISIFPSFSCGGTSPGVEQIFYVGPVTFIGASGPSSPAL
jgi:hypothetical protein